MKKIIAAILVGGLLLSCASSQKLLEKGKYEKAINKSAEKLRKDPGDNDELRVLKEAYYQANRIDKDRIEFLEEEGRDQNWLEIYNLYVRLDNRQDKVEALPQRVRSEFDFVDYDDEIIESKETAASVAYDRGMRLLRKGGKVNAREAYYNFEEAYNIYPDYKDVRQRIDQAHFRGMNHVLFAMENNSEVLLPEDFDAELRKVALKELNTLWVNFDTNEDTTKAYDYLVVLNIKNIAISPEQSETETYTESREIQDGMRYVFDENGNVKKDSLGNDIRVPNIVEVTAEVKERIQRKSARVAGSLEYISLFDDQLVKTDDISVEAVFEHFSASAVGNEKALSEESREKINSRPIPFPSDEVMLMDASALLKNRAKALVSNSRNILEG